MSLLYFAEVGLADIHRGVASENINIPSKCHVEFRHAYQASACPITRLYVLDNRRDWLTRTEKVGAYRPTRSRGPLHARRHNTQTGPGTT